MVPVPRTKLVPSPGQASPAGRAYGPPPSCGGAGQRGGDGDADAVPPGLGETRSRAVLAWARSESRRVMLLPKETLGSRGGGGGGELSAIPCLLSPLSRRSPSSHLSLSSAEEQLRPAEVSWRPLWLLPRKEEALSADQFISGLSCARAPPFSGDGCHPRDSQPGLRVVRESRINRPLCGRSESRFLIKLSTSENEITPLPACYLSFSFHSLQLQPFQDLPPLPQVLKGIFRKQFTCAAYCVRQRLWGRGRILTAFPWDFGLQP